ncbi:hypothetical protein ZWY2020_047583 [Hordeum vulgare]|nr:hypothetical protein ZWY2020_047583 [Hordeum vulgare]
MAAPLLFLLLLLPLAPSLVSSAVVAPAPKPGKFVTKELRTTINKSVKDYMSQRAGRPGQRKDGVQQTGSPAGDSYSPFIFDLSVGTSPQTLPVIMDITTDLVWAKCEPCPSCLTLSPSF